MKGFEEVWIECPKCKGTGKWHKYDGVICHWCNGYGYYWIFGDKKDTRLKPDFAYYNNKKHVT